MCILNICNAHSCIWYPANDQVNDDDDGEGDDVDDDDDYNDDNDGNNDNNGGHAHDDNCGGCGDGEYHDCHVDDYNNDDRGDYDDEIYNDTICTYNRLQHQQTLSLNLLLAPLVRL